MPGPKHILVMRFSAMGDVAMTVPVVKALLDQNPEVTITYASRPEFAEFFKNIPRLNFYPADLKELYKGLGGLIKLFNHLKSQEHFDAVADLHNNLRTQILRRLFRLTDVKTAALDKGRAEKKLLTRFPNKVLKPLKRTTERYADVFREIGFDVILDYKLVKGSKPLTDDIISITGEKTTPWIGISPFAKHKGKIYPLEKMEEVIAELDKQDVKIFLFGGSVNEQEVCSEWEKKYTNVISTVRILNMQQEFVLINNLDVMLSMDSAGMHLASLEGTPVVSIWGATHHYAGFLGYGQSENDIVADTIECRPCSVYGNKPCFRKDYACLHRINAETIVDKLTQYTR
ncbi:glycosyltransferase family 9 protein [Mucilaginibacter sp. X5P1]|uniref:glycosyltransferase family 9 protein n=1 Tax=Mucilaginibacter sp. X5P1 TaxID=2723088 RepID=UPI001617D740|nr:glycosyltransferase family 9 protein [Mucilaginibacter sp. X5P1]MBB6138164.1 ADP-heptose:LPS heptosyltransferase [Mucilaginibacter sp. X5P1]